MWNLDFWKAAGERAVRAGAYAVLSLWAIADGVMNALSVNWAEAGGVFFGAVVLSLLGSVVGNGVTKSGPSFNQTETVTPPSVLTDQ